MKERKKAIKDILEGESGCLQNTSGPQSARGGNEKLKTDVVVWGGGV